MALYWRVGRGGVRVGLYVITLSTGWFDEDQRHLGYDAVFVNETVATRYPSNLTFIFKYSEDEGSEFVRNVDKITKQHGAVPQKGLKKQITPVGLVCKKCKIIT